MIETILSGTASLAWTLAAFVVALSIIVAVHEYGHYIVGRWTGIGAEVFSVGFGPILLARTDPRGTRWQLAALPFGGYVKFKGDANAASVGRSDGPAQPHIAGQSIHDAPLWARAATVAAGPVFNFVLALMIFTGLILAEGRLADPLAVGEPGAAQGVLVPGDVVLAVGGARVTDAADLRAIAADLPPEGTVWTVEREGVRLDLEGPHPFPAIVAGVTPMSAASETALADGDVIVAVDGMDVPTFDALRKVIGATDGRPVALTVRRGTETYETTLTPRRTDIPQAGGGFETRYLIGVVGGLAFEPATQGVGVAEAIRLAGERFVFLITSSLEGMWSIARGWISTCNLTGPIGIAETSGAMAQEGGRDFINFIAVLSAAVGLINLFPIPILDGGHLVFHAYEAVRGRPPSDRALRVLMAGGLAVILSLMLFAITNDLFCP